MESGIALDWYCETYKCKMTKAACDLRREKANKKSWTDRSITKCHEAGCGTCRQTVSEVKQMVEKEEATRECNRCHRVLPLTKSFYRTSKGSWDGACKKCRYEQEKSWRIKKGIMTGIPKEDYRIRIGDEPVKECKKCHEILPLRAYYENKSARDKRDGICRKCRNIKARDYLVSTIKEKEKVNQKMDQTAPVPLKIKTVVVPCDGGNESAPGLNNFPKGLVPFDLQIPEPSETRRENSILIDFSDYPEMFSAVIDAARKEFRTPGMQILYMINHGMK